MADKKELQKVLGEVVQEHRLRQDLLLRDVAEATGLTLGYVSNIEHGRGNPTWTTLADLADALGMSLVELVTAVHQRSKALKRKRKASR